MAEQVQAADYVIVVCSENYRERFEGRAEGGLGARWEGALITQALYEDVRGNTKFIPVVFGDSGSSIPMALRPYTYYKYPEGYEELYRSIGQQSVLGSIRWQCPTTPSIRERTRSVKRCRPNSANC